MHHQKILIVEDEIKLANILADYFLAENFDVVILQDGNDVVGWVKNNDVSAILLDLMLPRKDGMAICKEVRAFSNVPILMITARVDEIDRILGLDIGADDYICKPFSPREVVARVKSILRRTQGDLGRDRPWKLDETRFEFSHQSTTISLTAVEFHMLKKLCNDPGRIYTRNQLMENMYSDHRIVSERTIDSHVKKLRKKLNTTIPDFIESVYGVGYRVSPTV
ncbi:MAG: two-component system response regulator BaeR [Flavobacterium sp.]|jgi:two-component system response regulator BaeR